MTEYSDLIREHKAEIAAHAVHAADCEDLVAYAEEIVLAAANASDGDGPIDGTAMESLQAHDGLARLLVRAIEVGCLDCVYQHDDSDAARDFAASLRARFLRLHPPQAPPRHASFFSRWERPEMESSAPEQAAMLRSLATILSNVVEMVYVHDEAGVLQYVNERCAEVTGYSREELLAPMTIHDFLPPEHSELVSDRLATLGPGPQSPFTLEILNRWGQRVPLEFRLQLLALELTPGNPEQFVLVCAHDCHLSRRLERRIEAMDGLERRVLHSLPVSVLITGADLVVQEVNPPAMACMGAESREELVGQPVYALLSEEDSTLQAKLRSVLESGEEWRSEWHGRTRQGAEFHAEAVVIPLGGEVDGLIIVLRDMHHESRRNQAQIQAQKLQALGTTIAGVSHELNNPLTGIVGYTQLLLTSDIPPSIRARVDHIAMEARRAQRIVQNLLTFAQRHETRKTLHDVNHVVRNVLALQEYQLRVDGVSLTAELEPDLPTTLIDVNALQTVCLHIVNNAHQSLIESGKADKRLLVRSFVKDGLIHVSFEDSGTGIDRDTQARIFDPFFTTREPGAGPGLGLSVSYGIVQDHGGQILLESTEGVGSTFTLILPIREEAPGEPLVREP